MSPFAAGVDGVASLDPMDLVVWLMKVLVGLVTFENGVHGAADGTTRPVEVPEEVRERYRFLFDCLGWFCDGADLRVADGGAPRVQLFECLTADDLPDDPLAGHDEVGFDREEARQRLRAPIDFGYDSDAGNGVIALRSGRIGLIGALTSWPLRGHDAPIIVRRFPGARLHPVQFRELFARTAFTAAQTPTELTGILVGAESVRGIVMHPVSRRGHTRPSRQMLDYLLARVWKVDVADLRRRPSFFSNGQPHSLRLDDYLDVEGKPLVWLI